LIKVDNKREEEKFRSDFIVDKQLLEEESMDFDIDDYDL
jgi:hypothetical protein